MAAPTVLLVDRELRIRAFAAKEAELLWERARAFAAEAGTEPTQRWRETLEARVARSGEFHDGYLFLAIEGQGRLVGSIDVRSGSPMPDGVVEVGLELFEVEDRGRGFGSRAARLLFEYLFESGVARVQATTPAGNEAARRVLERCGFAYEGTLRAYLPRPEGREDAALYARVRDPRRLTS